MKAWLLVLGIVGAAAPAGAKGFHADVHAGLDHLGADGDGTNGSSYGLAIGYDVEQSRTFYGVELTADASNTRDCERDVLVAGDRGCLQARADSALVGRVGAAVANSAKIYVLAGYALAELRASYRLGTVREREKVELDGLRVGTGVQLDLTRSILAKLEYRYTNYESDVSRHQALVGIGIRF